jgi:hypothetical protein
MRPALVEINAQNLAPPTHPPLASCRDISKTSSALLGLLATFLAGWGRDLPVSALAKLHGAMRPWLRHAWSASRQPRLREALAGYCRLQLQLGGAQVGMRAGLVEALPASYPAVAWAVRGSRTWRGRAPGSTCHAQLPGVCCRLRLPA